MIHILSDLIAVLHYSVSNVYKEGDNVFCAVMNSVCICITLESFTTVILLYILSFVYLGKGMVKFDHLS